MLLKDLYAIIPAYNSEKTIDKVISDLRAHLSAADIIVVDDGSSDSTSEIARALKTIVIAHKKNLGKGAALKSGFKKALSLGAKFVLTLDADGQHNPKDVNRFLSKYEETPFDIIIGSRMANIRDMPIHRILSNKITSQLISWRVGQRVPDSQCGFRLIKADVLKNLQLKTNRFDMESELILKASKKGHKIGFVNIDTIYSNNSTSAMNLIKDTSRFIWVYIHSFLGINM
jgi:glycosyltransferase involved in cell wall biosynthesis